MKTFFKLLKWDLVLLAKYGILPVALGIGVLYIALIYLLNMPTDIVVLLIFSDPSMMGFIFIGVMVLFEKQSGTTLALIVTPLRAWQYLMSKSISLSIPALLVSLLMAFASNAEVNYFLIILSVTLTSILFLLLGFVGAQKVKTFNQYILIIPMFLAPLCIPIIDFLGLFRTSFMWLIPTHSSLTLLKSAYYDFLYWEIILSISILLIYIYIAWRWALEEYSKGMTITD